MAPLTWRNVEAPEMGNAARILESAGAGFSQGMAGLGTALGGIGTARNTRVSAGALPVLAKVASEQGVDAAINQVSGMVNPNQWSPELQQAVLGLRESALGYEKQRADTGYVGANTARVLGGESRDQTDFTRRIASEDQLMAQAGDIVRMRQGAYAGNAGTGISPASAAIGRAAGGQVSSSSTLSQLLNKHEGAGNYDTLFGHSQKNGPFAGTRVSEMSVGDAIRFSDPKGPYAQWVKDQVGRVATPMGAGQIVGTTLKTAVSEMGLDPNTRFDAATQNAVIDHLGRKRIAASSTIEGKRAGLRAEWEGFKNVPDAELDRVIAEMESGKPASVGSPNTGGMYDPALGANYSTVQQQGGQAYVPDVASLVPASGNRVLPDDYLTLVTDNWKAGDTARTDMDADRERDRAFERSVITSQRDDREDARKEEVIATEQFAIDKADELWAAQAAPGEAAKGVYADQSMTPEQKSATLARLGVLEGAAGNYFEAPELTGDALARDNALTRAVQASGARASMETELNPLLGIFDEVEATQAASGGDDAAAVTTQLDELAKGGIDVGTTPADKADILDGANKLAEKYGINPQTVLRLANSSLKSGFWREWWGNDVVINEDKLERVLQSYGDPQMWADAKALRTRLSEESGALAQAQADYRKYAGQSENLAARGTPAALKEAEVRSRKAAEALQRAEAIGRQIEQGFSERAETFKTSSKGPVQDGLTAFLGTQAPAQGAPGTPVAPVDKALTSAAAGAGDAEVTLAAAQLAQAANPGTNQAADPRISAVRGGIGAVVQGAGNVLEQRGRQAVSGVGRVANAFTRAGGYGVGLVAPTAGSAILSEADKVDAYWDRYAAGAQAQGAQAADAGPIPPEQADVLVKQAQVAPVDVLAQIAREAGATDGELGEMQTAVSLLIDDGVPAAAKSFARNKIAATVEKAKATSGKLSPEARALLDRSDQWLAPMLGRDPAPPKNGR